MTQWLFVLSGIAGLAGLLVILSAWVHQPVLPDDSLTICYVQGGGSELEHLARAYGRIRTGGRLLLVDCGLTAEGLTLAQHLQQRHPWIVYCPCQALQDYLELTEDRI